MTFANRAALFVGYGVIAALGWQIAQPLAVAAGNRLAKGRHWRCWPVN